MQTDLYLILAAGLVGIGIGSALSRRNLIAIIMAIVTAGSGALIAMATLDWHSEKSGDGMLFALCLGTMLMVFVVLGCAIAYRRYISSGATNIVDGNHLRH